MFKEIFKLLGKDNLQVQALSECYEMLDLSHQMVVASVETLRRRDDTVISLDLYELDKRLNSFERDVRRKVMTHLSLGHMQDVASGLVLVSIVIDLERIGDYSKNIYDLAQNHPKRLTGGPLAKDLDYIEERALSNFTRAVAAFKSGDEHEGRKLMINYKEDISAKCREMEKKLVTGQVQLDTAEAVATALYMRFLKRISAHSRNLVSSVVNPFDRIGYPE